MAHRQSYVLGHQHFPGHGSLKPPMLQTPQGFNVESGNYAYLLRFRSLSLHHYRPDATLLHLGGLQERQQREIKETLEALFDSIYAQYRLQ